MSLSNWQTLPNHRHIPHPSISSPFPFPKGFFSAVVFRFPVATSDAAYHAAIYECKRVLRAGGFLEISVLDLDLMNMGNNGRKAVRSLKISMQESDKQLSLRNIGDTMMTLVGRRGFENIQRCVVGIPAAGRIPRSQDFSSTGSGKSALRYDDYGEAAHAKEANFADFLYGRLNGSSGDGETGKEQDECITKMVAKVGRWWYSTCYEKSMTTGEGEQESIWDRPGLLRECERQGTSFRLLLCYAQKPCTKRRTVSV